MNRNVSFSVLTDLLRQFDEEHLRALVEYPDDFKKFANDMVIKSAQSTFFKPMSDFEMPGFEDLAAKWRPLAAELGYVGPIVWSVREGFTLKSHTSLSVLCHDNLECIKDRDLVYDEPTKKAVVFWVPRLLPSSKGLHAKDQIYHLAETRLKFGLPDHHLSSFGSAVLASGLMLAHHKRTGERAPANSNWVRTETFTKDGCRLALNFDHKLGLCCSFWLWGSDHGGPSLGCFPIGVELINE